MNSYSVYRYYQGYFGPEINDGEINPFEDVFYTLKEITSKFVDLFPSPDSYTLYKDYYTTVRNYISGEEADKIFNQLNTDLLVDLYSIVSRDYKTKLKQYLDLYEDIYDRFLYLHQYPVMSIEDKIKVLRQILLEHGYNVSAIDDDMIEQMIKNVEGWLS